MSPRLARTLAALLILGWAGGIVMLLRGDAPAPTGAARMGDRADPAPAADPAGPATGARDVTAPGPIGVVRAALERTVVAPGRHTDAVSGGAAGEADGFGGCAGAAALQGTYLDEALRECRVVRWPDDATIGVWVAPRSALPGFQPGFVRAAQAGVLAWNAIALPVRFVLADSAEAQVHVTWAAALGGEQVGLSQTNFTEGGRKDGTITDATTQLALRQPYGRAWTAEDIQATATHEAGHILGLGHTSRAGSLMTPKPRDGERPRITPLDAASARRLYTLPRGPLGQ